jgi:hypothetical protein
MIKEDPYFIRYSDRISICREGYRYGTFNIISSIDLFKNKEKEFSNSFKNNQLYINYQRKN